jgi:hypothetical protein
MIQIRTNQRRSNRKLKRKNQNKVEDLKRVKNKIETESSKN